MIKRTTKRLIPDKRTYFKIESESSGTFDFKVPFPTVLSSLGSAIRKQQRELEQTEDPEMISSISIKLNHLFGSFLGLCWFNADYDLESTFTGDYELYGLSVLSELFDEGYSLQECLYLATNCMPNVYRIVTPVSKQEVDDAVNFTQAKE